MGGELMRSPSNVSFVPSGLVGLSIGHPRLAPWAVILRRFAAWRSANQVSKSVLQNYYQFQFCRRQLSGDIDADQFCFHDVLPAGAALGDEEILAVDFGGDG